MSEFFDEKAHEDSVRARVAPLLAALGIGAGQYTPMDLVRIERAVLVDPVVFQRKRKYAEGAFMPAGTTLRVVQEMSREDRDALVGRVCERVGAKVAPVGTPTGVRVVG